ncbi:MAG: hypothetical protein AAGF59_14415 [Pseudomonadota bacterium]
MAEQLVTGQQIFETDTRSITIDEVLMYVVEVNDRMAEEFGVDLTSAAAAAIDSTAAATIVRKLGLSGRAYLKDVNGKTYVILKGLAGKRADLTGTRYLSTNPKVAKLAIGSKNLLKGAARMTGIAIIAYSGLRVVEHLLSDGDQRLTQLFGTIASDIVKFAIAAGAGFLVGAAVGTITTIAAGPVIAAVIVGIGISILLDRVDRKYGLTETLVRAIEDTVDSFESPFRKLSRYINAWEEHFVQQAINNTMRFR